MSRNDEILRQVVGEMSVTANPFSEWKLDGIEIGEASCACSKAGIKNICHMKNVHTGEVIIVGNCCVRKFFGEDYSGEFRRLHYKVAREERRERHREEIDAIRKMQEACGSWEKNFLDSVKNCLVNGWGLSSKQEEVYQKIRDRHSGKDSVLKASDPKIVALDSLIHVTEWEKDFLCTVKKYMVEGRELSAKQRGVFDRILRNNGLTYEKFFDIRYEGKDEVEAVVFDGLPFVPRKPQIEAYQRWKAGNYKGTVKIGTGIGKTFIGLMIHNQFPKSKMLIVVHTEALLNQWKDVFKKELGIDVGVYYGKEKDFRQVTVAIINSIRDITELDFDILILDECHHYVSDRNISLLRYNTFDKILALSATPERDDLAHKMLFDICPLVYEYDQSEGINDGHLSRYNVVNVGTSFIDEAENADYQNYSSIIRQAMEAFETLDNIKSSLINSELARQAMSAIVRRRILIADNMSKVAKAVEIVEGSKFDRCFIFNEFIKTANKSYEILKSHGYKVGLYHSKLKAKDRKDMLKKFKDGDYNIIVAVKALDEGVDVPSADLAVIVGRTKQVRQSVQRSGRILRKKPTASTIYNIYVRGTADEKWLRNSLLGMSGASKIEWR
jgi:superfamily II DNA or RNA helicase